MGLTSAPGVRLCLTEQRPASCTPRLGHRLPLSTIKTTQHFSFPFQEHQQRTQNFWQSLGKTGIVAASHIQEHQDLNALLNLGRAARQPVGNATHDALMEITKSTIFTTPVLACCSSCRVRRRKQADDIPLCTKVQTCWTCPWA